MRWLALVGAAFLVQGASVAQVTTSRPGANERILVAALRRYLAEDATADRKRLCFLGEGRVPLPKTVIDHLEGLDARPSCPPSDAPVYAVVGALSGSTFEVDVLREQPPCGPTWECWTGPTFHGVYTIQDWPSGPRVLAYRAIVLNGDLVVSDAEYEARSRLVSQRLGRPLN